MILKKKFSQKTKFTRMCISEAIVALMEKQEFARIKISDIVKKAGIARMSFYKYYSSTYEALTDYLQIIIADYIDEGQELHGENRFLEYSHIVYSLKYFDRYAAYFLALTKQKLHAVLLDGINRFMTENLRLAKQLSPYELYSYAGSLLNSFLKWEECGKKDSVEEVASAIYRLYGSKEGQALA